MLALNCYRALVTKVGKEGWESVPEEERDGLTPSAPPTPEYIASFRWLDTPEKKWEPTDRFLRAQQTWDRAFACNMVHAMNEAKEKGDEPPLVIGVIGGGHMYYKQGSVYQLKDLGVDNVGVLLTNSEEEVDLEKIHGIADAVFRIDVPEPSTGRPTRPEKSS